MSQPSLGFVGGADGPVTVFASGGGTALLIYLALINLTTFIIYGADKRRARQGKWRVPEKTLFLLPLLGGSVVRCWVCGCFTTRRSTGISSGACPSYCWHSWHWRSGY